MTKFIQDFHRTILKNQYWKLNRTFLNQLAGFYCFINNFLLTCQPIVVALIHWFVIFGILVLSIRVNLIQLIYCSFGPFFFEFLVLSDVPYLVLARFLMLVVSILRVKTCKALEQGAFTARKNNLIKYLSAVMK